MEEMLKDPGLCKAHRGPYVELEAPQGCPGSSVPAAGLAAPPRDAAGAESWMLE